MRILVTGGRDYSDRERAFAELDAIHKAKPIACLIQGGAKGADSLAELWCETRGVCCLRVRAPWSTHGKAAGTIRNGWMLKHCGPIDAVVAFPGGRGTANMVSQAGKAGIYIHKVAP